MVATPDGVWHRDSHYRRKLIVQDTDLNKGVIGRIVANYFSGKKSGGSGALQPPYVKTWKNTGNIKKNQEEIRSKVNSRGDFLDFVNISVSKFRFCLVFWRSWRV